MPTPYQNESEQEFISRCIPTMIDEGKEQEQATAICYSIWEQKMNLSETHQHTLEAFDDKVVWIIKKFVSL